MARAMGDDRPARSALEAQWPQYTGSMTPEVRAGQRAAGGGPAARADERSPPPERVALQEQEVARVPLPKADCTPLHGPNGESLLPVALTATKGLYLVEVRVFVRACVCACVHACVRAGGRAGGQAGVCLWGPHKFDSSGALPPILLRAAAQDTV